MVKKRPTNYTINNGHIVRLPGDADGLVLDNEVGTERDLVGVYSPMSEKRK
jgi:hypothetical protein